MRAAMLRHLPWASEGIDCAWLAPLAATQDALLFFFDSPIMHNSASHVWSAGAARRTLRCGKFGATWRLGEIHASSLPAPAASAAMWAGAWRWPDATSP